MKLGRQRFVRGNMLQAGGVRFCGGTAGQFCTCAVDQTIMPMVGVELFCDLTEAAEAPDKLAAVALGAAAQRRSMLDASTPEAGMDTNSRRSMVK
eukprot:CAMPEP_0185907024 /NCGR_PEP_ID=MMETSP0196C-20130402/6257_1 /TAXON_ID=2932 /ORGANISM="Alexandrium fundyense, Strain CCMP1719" /LENGTH=94 /DNA_ID=CAMNT_0028626889 /DNA_START=34 /DNA_END=315 /DNA_ORIENTATION=-